MYDNSQYIGRGIQANDNGTYTVMTFTAEGTFKTLVEAVRFLKANS